MYASGRIAVGQHNFCRLRQRHLRACRCALHSVAHRHEWWQGLRRSVVLRPIPGAPPLRLAPTCAPLCVPLPCGRAMLDSAPGFFESTLEKPTFFCATARARIGLTSSVLSKLTRHADPAIYSLLQPLREAHACAREAPARPASGVPMSLAALRAPCRPTRTPPRAFQQLAHACGAGHRACGAEPRPSVSCGVALRASRSRSGEAAHLRGWPRRLSATAGPSESRTPPPPALLEAGLRS